MVVVAAPENRKLPKKEQDLFRSIVKFYEIKQYKKGLKAADSILKKFPTHGETQAMKGLVLNCMDKKEEAYELVKQGLRNDVRSHICWHVFGLLHRSDRNHGEAIKCYLNALRIEKNNMQILKDLGNLQVQMRDLEGFVETKRKILQENAKIKVHWIGYAVANHLVGDMENALQVIDSFLGTLDKREKGYEEGELVLYKAIILEQAGRLEESLQLLETERTYVVDGLSWRTQRAELLLRMERFEEAQAAFRALLGENSEHYRYHAGLQCAVLHLDAATSTLMLALKGCALPSTELPALTDAQRNLLVGVYEELGATEKGSLVCDKVPLTFLTGEAFKVRVDAYMRKHVKRGLPSLGSDLAALYVTTDPETGRKQRAKDAYDIRRNERYLVVRELVDGYIDSLKKMGAFPPSSAPTQNGTSNSSGSDASGKNEGEDTLLWATFLRVQLLEAAGELAAALADIETCLEHEETALDMLQRKARLLKKSGDVTQAAAVMDTARQRDLNDRYVNNKTTKYMLRAGRVEDAQGVIALFAKHEGDPQVYLCEMQCMWYELEWARAMQNKEGGGKEALGKALKKYVAVEKHFTDFVEDQFDFHNYCIRKMTLRAYVDVLKLEDDLLAHSYYRQAAHGIIACYLALLAQPKEEEGTGETDKYAGMTAAERKREKAKARKEAKKLETEAAEAEAQQKAAAAAAVADGEEEKKGKKPGEGSKGPVDDDPNGVKLAAKDPLVEAARVVVSLTRHAGKFVETHVLAYDVAVKRGKALLGLQALIKGQALQPQHPEVVVRTVDFLQALQEKKEGSWAASLHPTVATVIEAEKAGLLGGAKDVKSYVEAYVSKAEGWASLVHVLAAARALTRIQPGAMEKAVGLVKAAVKGESRGLTVERLKEVLRVIENDLNAGPAAVAEVRKLCAARFPLAAAFQE